MLNRSKSSHTPKSVTCYRKTADNSSLMFHRFPMRHTSPSMHRAWKKKHQSQATEEETACTVPKLSIGFDINAKRQYGLRVSEDCIALHENKAETKPLIRSFCVEKCELQERFKVVEIHRKICKHCNFENFFCKTDASNRQPNLARSYEELLNEKLYRDWSKVMPHKSKDESEESDTIDSRPLMKTEIKRQKIVVQMPKVTLSVNEDEKDEKGPYKARTKATLSYTHRKI